MKKNISPLLLPDFNEKVINSASALKKVISSCIDHTLLKADATEAMIVKLCQEATEHGFYSVCVNGSYVSFVRNILKNTSIQIVSVVGFPLGACSSAAKTFEAENSIQNGATEIDMVINLGMVKSRNWTAVEKDIASLTRKAKLVPVKVILETSYLNSEEIIQACKVSENAGASFVKTSTGFSNAGATQENIQLMRKTVKEKLGVKASGGIKTLFDALTMLQAGANRLGLSGSCALVEEIKEGSYQNFLNHSSSSNSTPNGGY